MVEYKCIVCDTKYNRLREHMKSPYLKKYIKHLGCCGMDCYKKLNSQEKDELFLKAYLDEMVKDGLYKS